MTDVKPTSSTSSSASNVPGGSLPPNSEPVTVLVVGGSGDIGRAMVSRLLGAGHRVVATGRDAERLKALPDNEGCEARVLADAADFDAVDALVSEVSVEAEEAGLPLRGVANCAGSILLKPAHGTSIEDFESTLRQNLHTAFATVRAAGRHLRKGGSVLLFSTAAVRLGLQYHEAIAAAKGGVEGLVRAAASTYAAQGLRVNALAPGLVETRLTERILATDAGRRASESLHALGRLGQPADIASMGAFLLHPDNDWITGQVLGVDGGLSSVRTRG